MEHRARSLGIRKSALSTTLRLVTDQLVWEHRDQQSEHGELQFHHASAWVNDPSVWDDMAEIDLGLHTKAVVK